MRTTNDVGPEDPALRGENQQRQGWCSPKEEQSSNRGRESN